ncbi:Serpin domain protein [Raphanus sativus]|nr:Serpin domain protein [Raphanus sativus]
MIDHYHSSTTSLFRRKKRSKNRKYGLQKINGGAQRRGVRLAKHVIATIADGCNLVFSPTSINVLLSIIAAGSSSVTKEHILSFLNSPLTDHLNAIFSEIVSVALRDSDKVSE